VAESLRYVIDENSKTAEVRRVARKMAGEIGLDETVAEHVCIVVTEACTNLLKHAGRGEMILRSSTEGLEPSPLLEMMALDQGPGLNSLSDALRDGFSTGTSPGNGLGAIVRLSGDSDFYSIPKRGTAVLARWWTPVQPRVSALAVSPLRVSAMNVPKPGEDVSGDSWGSIQSGDDVVVLVADGLGHGVEASLASLEAVRMLRGNPDLAPKALLQRIHQALRSTRGAAVAIARINGAAGKLTFAGVGNISARIYSGVRPCQHLVSVNGTAGQQFETLREFSYPWPEDGLLQIHSDGLTTAAGLEDYPGLALRDPALIAAVLYRDFGRGRDDSTVVIAKAA
jgi:anti-sigma regulatory factor (Ser/Thr protein kinase)